MKSHELKLSSLRRGFTLTELAIVLGIVGLILGAIWTVTADLYGSFKLNLAQQEVDLITSSTRSLYGGRTLDQGVLTATLLTTGIFPNNMVNGGILMNPWGTTSPIATTAGSGVDVGSGVGWGGVPAIEPYL